MRIVSGKHRGRVLKAPLKSPRGSGTRPTASRAREAIFNVLAHGVEGPGLSGARVADVFAGTGALGLEALSRGAAHCIFVESDRDAERFLKENIEALGEDACATLVRCEAARLGVPPGGAVDYVFLDAPYGEGLSEPALVTLSRQGWLKNDTIVTVEIAARETLILPRGFSRVKDKALGAARVLFLRYGTD